MSRRQTDLEPGVEPDAGEPEPYRAPNGPNGRPPTPPPAWRPGTGRPPGRSHRAARRGRPANDRTERRPPTSGGGSSPSLRWVPWIVLALIAAAFLVSSLASSSSSKADLTYSQFVNAVDDGNVKSIEFNKSTGEINGMFVDTGRRQDGVHELRPEGRPPRHRRSTTLNKKDVDVNYVDDGQQHPRRHPALGAAARADHRACSCG